MTKTVIGIMGPGLDAEPMDIENSYNIGKYAAQKGYVTLTGGRNVGVMHSALKGAKDSGGDTIGILAYGNKTNGSEYADILIVTSMTEYVKVVVV